MECTGNTCLDPSLLHKTTDFAIPGRLGSHCLTAVDLTPLHPTSASVVAGPREMGTTLLFGALVAAFCTRRGRGADVATNPITVVRPISVLPINGNRGRWDGRRARAHGSIGGKHLDLKVEPLASFGSLRLAGAAADRVGGAAEGIVTLARAAVRERVGAPIALARCL